MTKEHVANMINDEYKEWSIGDKVTINFQTGSRKTTFILDLYIH